MAKIKPVDEFVKALIAIGGQREADFKGCTDEEVQEIMKAQQVDFLPKIYIDFMKRLGKDTRSVKIFRGEHIWYDCVIESKDELGYTFVDNTDTPLWCPIKNLFVFWVHDGYQFFFFYINDGENPPIYMWQEGDEKPELIVPSFSKLLDWFSSRHMYYMENVPEYRMMS